MEKLVFLRLLTGLVFLGAFNLVFSNPLDHDDLDMVQNDDDYDYSDDESMPNVNSKSPTATLTPPIEPYFTKNNLTVFATIGKNVTLQCEVKNLSDNNVILWYKNANLLSTGKEVLHPEYFVDPMSFGLTIVNVSESNAGDYFCEVQPQKIQLHTKLVVYNQAIENIIPESSTSAQDSLYWSTSKQLLGSSVIGILLFLRI